jgi:hypothetical protein
MKQIIKFMVKMLLIVALAAAVVSCKKEPESVTVEPATLTLGIGETAILTATVLPSKAVDKDVVWNSDAPAIVAVNPSTGTITALALGTALITASTSNGKIGTCTVTVTSSGTGGGKGDVYVVGYEIRKGAFLWVNGKYTKLEGNNARSVYVSGNDVYVAMNSGTEALVWKNGDITSLGVSTYANSIFVVGNDVYVAGSLNAKATVWKNGIATTLTDSLSSALSVYVLGNDVYVAGYAKDNEYSKATVWKNKVATLLNAYESAANSIFVYNNDVYIAGYEKSGGESVAVLWKNGVATTYPALFESSANSVFVSNGDVYVAGENGSDAIVWINGKVNRMSTDANLAYANSVFVSGDDVYVCGYIDRGYDVVATTWKNKEEIPLELPDDHRQSFATSIFVK